MNLEDIVDQIRRAQLLGAEPPPLEDIADDIEASMDDGCPECEAREDEGWEAGAAMDRLIATALNPKCGRDVVLDAIHELMKATNGQGYDIRDARELFAGIGQTYMDHIESIKGGAK